MTVKVCDSTLRDGSHAKGHLVTVDEVRSVVRALDAAQVPVIEVSHGDGLGGSSFNYGFSETDEFVLIRAAVDTAITADIAVLILPGIGVKGDLTRARDLGVRVARVATHCTEANIAIQHLGLARELGLVPVGFLMMAHMVEPKELATQASIMAESGASIVYVTDSAGALLPAGARDRVRALRDALPEDVEIGFHGHNNLSLGVANSMAAVEAGATWIDACMCGMGAGAGNTQTEVLGAVFDKAGVKTGLDPFALMDAADEIVRPMLPRPLNIDRAALVLGHSGVYSSFLLHAERAAERFGASVHEILMEAGRRRAVGGQEDLLIEIAAELSGRP